MIDIHDRILNRGIIASTIDENQRAQLLVADFKSRDFDRMSTRRKRIVPMQFTRDITRTNKRQFHNARTLSHIG